MSYEYEKTKFIADKIWEDFQKRNAKFFDDIADHIYRTGNIPLIHMEWDDVNNDVKARIEDE